MVVVAQCGFVNGVNLCFWGLDGKGHGRNDEVQTSQLWFVVVILFLGLRSSLCDFLERFISTYLIPS